ncbi:MAG: carbohydrate-binding protein [Bacteroidota bacterium]
MKRTFPPLLLLLLTNLFPLLSSGQAPAGYALNWSDEFNGNALDGNNWTIETGSFYWANQEQQYYVPDAIVVNGGTLKITARWDASENRIESGRFNSRDKRELGDGYYEARVRFTGTYHNSIFAAFWSMGYRHDDFSYPAHALPSGHAWPSCGEIDFMEWVGSDDDRNQANGEPDDGLFTPMSACHYNPQPNNAEAGGWPHNWTYDTHYGTAGDLNPYAWHTVGAEVDGTTCTFYFNGVPYQTYNIGAQSELMEDRYMICNFAIGGTLSDPFYPEWNLPNTIMEWDYVRHYTKSGGSSPGHTIIPAKIEAEHYSGMNGIQVEPCSAGGQNVGHFDVGDWFALDIDIPMAGTYQLEAQVASINGGNILVEMNAGATSLGTINVPATTWWQIWAVSQPISVTLPAGQHTIGFATSTGGINVDWVEFKQVTNSVRVEAENFSVNSGTQVVHSSVSYIGHVDPGEYTTYEPIALPDGAGYYDVTFRVASQASNTSFNFEQVGGATTYATVNVPNTGGWESFTDLTQQNIYLPGTGNYALAFNTSSINVDYLEFVKVGAPRLAASAIQDELEPELPSFTLTPNPATDNLLIRDIPAGTQGLSIHNSVGQTIRAIPLVDQETHKLDLSGLVSGVYWLESRGVYGRMTQAFIKN